MLALQILAGWLGSLGFALLFKVRGSNLFYASFAGFISSFIYLGLVDLYGVYTSIFLATICFALYCEIVSRIKKATVTTFLICGLIPLVPGSGMYYMMLAFVSGNMNEAGLIATQTLTIAGLIALGIILVSTFVKFYPGVEIKWSYKYYRKKDM